MRHCSDATRHEMRSVKCVSVRYNWVIQIRIELDWAWDSEMEVLGVCEGKLVKLLENTTLEVQKGCQFVIMGGPSDQVYVSMGQACCGGLFGVVEKSVAVADMGDRFFGRNEPQPPV